MKRVALCVAALGLAAGACGGSGGGSSSSSSDSPGGVTGGKMAAGVSAKSLAFSPSTVKISKGGTVTWKFDDNPTPHNVTAADGSFKTDNMTTGTFSHTFPAPGTFKYTCTIHPSMKGTVVVS